MTRPRLLAGLAVPLLAVLLAACGSAAFPPGTIVVGGERPVALVRPPDHDPVEPTALFVVLHGFAADPGRVERTFPLGSGAAVAGVLVVRPAGTPNALGSRFWNASDACCDLFGNGVDDVAYLMGLIDEIEEAVAVDRVVLFGHSNGGFMAYRLACEHGDRFAAVVTVAGALDDPSPSCAAPSPARVLHIHGTADSVVAYDGGRWLGRPPYTGALATTSRLAARAGCGGLSAGPPFDFDVGVPGQETTPIEADCPDGQRVVLWGVEGGGHEPTVRDDFAARVLAFALRE